MCYYMKLSTVRKAKVSGFFFQTTLNHSSKNKIAKKRIAWIISSIYIGIA